MLQMRSCGSSPLARGLPPQRRRGAPHTRIIPARAGFTRRIPTSRLCCRDHPRSRGVYPERLSRRSASKGSSPLARGLPVDLIFHPHQVRIIPARAGFTRLSPSRLLCPRDHPRSRGVYQGHTLVKGIHVGSSPLARGLRDGIVVFPVPARIIPARAGFTALRELRGRQMADHPRSRGVYKLWAYFWECGSGSSPLARGLRGMQVDGVEIIRIIPARAGFTPSSVLCCCVCWDHPRSRGVYQEMTTFLNVSEGSSPLARGLPYPVRRRAMMTRIIPARAGFTS